MNMLDGLKVRYDIDNYGEFEIGVIIQSQIITMSNHPELILAILNENGVILMININKLTFCNKQLEKIFRNPKQTIYKIRKAENTDTIEDRSEILDL